MFCFIFHLNLLLSKLDFEDFKEPYIILSKAQLNQFEPALTFDSKLSDSYVGLTAPESLIYGWIMLNMGILNNFILYYPDIERSYGENLNVKIQNLSKYINLKNYNENKKDAVQFYKTENFLKLENYEIISSILIYLFGDKFNNLSINNYENSFLGERLNLYNKKEVIKLLAVIYLIGNKKCDILKRKNFIEIKNFSDDYSNEKTIYFETKILEDNFIDEFFQFFINCSSNKRNYVIEPLNIFQAFLVLYLKDQSELIRFYNYYYLWIPKTINSTDLAKADFEKVCAIILSNDISITRSTSNFQNVNYKDHKVNNIFKILYYFFNYILWDPETLNYKKTVSYNLNYLFNLNKINFMSFQEFEDSLSIFNFEKIITDNSHSENVNFYNSDFFINFFPTEENSFSKNYLTNKILENNKICGIIGFIKILDLIFLGKFKLMNKVEKFSKRKEKLDKVLKIFLEKVTGFKYDVQIKNIVSFNNDFCGEIYIKKKHKSKFYDFEFILKFNTEEYDIISNSIKSEKIKKMKEVFNILDDCWKLTNSSLQNVNNEPDNSNSLPDNYFVSNNYILKIFLQKMSTLHEGRNHSIMYKFHLNNNIYDQISFFDALFSNVDISCNFTIISAILRFNFSLRYHNRNYKFIRPFFITYIKNVYGLNSKDVNFCIFIFNMFEDKELEDISEFDFYAEPENNILNNFSSYNSIREIENNIKIFNDTIKENKENKINILKNTSDEFFNEYFKDIDFNLTKIENDISKIMNEIIKDNGKIETQLIDLKKLRIYLFILLIYKCESEKYKNYLDILYLGLQFNSDIEFIDQIYTHLIMICNKAILKMTENDFEEACSSSQITTNKKELIIQSIKELKLNNLEIPEENNFSNKKVASKIFIEHNYNKNLESYNRSSHELDEQSNKKIYSKDNLQFEITKIPIEKLSKNCIWRILKSLTLVDNIILFQNDQSDLIYSKLCYLSQKNFHNLFHYCEESLKLWSALLICRFFYFENLNSDLFWYLIYNTSEDLQRNYLIPSFIKNFKNHYSNEKFKSLNLINNFYIMILLHYCFSKEKTLIFDHPELKNPVEECLNILILKLIENYDGEVHKYLLTKIEGKFGCFYIFTYFVKKYNLRNENLSKLERLFINYGK